jgi:hypothetical protein
MVHEEQGAPVVDSLFEGSEDVDVHEARPDVVGEGLGRLTDFQRRTGIRWPDEVGAGAQVDDFSREALRALGYAQ